mgnify:CR=1 FL=1
MYKRQVLSLPVAVLAIVNAGGPIDFMHSIGRELKFLDGPCLLYTSDAADERSSVDLGGRRSIKNKKNTHTHNTHSSMRQRVHGHINPTTQQGEAVAKA